MSRASGRVLIFACVYVVLMTLALGALLGRVVQLQTRPQSKLAARIGSQRSRVSEQARRGRIEDRLGRDMALSRTEVRLFADPSLITDVTAFARVVGNKVGYDPFWLEQQIRHRPGRRYVVIDPHLDQRRLVALKKLEADGSANPAGLGTQRWVVRHYPQGQLAGQLVGVAGFDGWGLEGLELKFDSELRGRSGSLTFLRDVRHRPVGIDPGDYQAPVDGRTVRLSIDLIVQSIAEEELAERCRRFGAPHGQMIVMEPRHGRVLAMANYPPFDPEKLNTSSPEQRRNRCVTDVFEPGSIFKPFVWAMATEQDFARVGELIDCTRNGVHRTSRGRLLRDASPHGLITWEQVLVLSSNIGMAIVCERLGASNLHRAVSAFGFGQRTGIALPGESAGIVHPLARWNHYSVTSIPMGQEIAVTPLQLVRALCAIANDGLMPLPSVRIEPRPDNDEPILIRVIAPETARLTRQVLRLAVTEGTGRRGNSPYYPIFGKTGTAQVPDPDPEHGYLEDQYVASFIGGAPVDRPRIVVGCFIHRPSLRSYYGGIVAAPGVKRVIERSLTYLGLPREYPP